jgi:predicted esterase
MKAKASRLLVLLLGAAAILWIAPAAQSQNPAPWWPAEVEQALDRAKDNRGELVKALTDVPQDHRQGMAFLVANMPDSDLRSLKADFLLENADLAYKARRQAPWSSKISEEMFLNDVLPYANVDENRHPWRKEFYERWWPVVKNCKTAAEAAQKLNETVFKELNVKYSTQRKKANQSPKESIEQGLASCTGLSIILIDACRSVGVPARIVGTPMWTDKSGNHNWVEVWDGTWHFVGACEPDPQGLDHAWFEAKAATALKDSPRNAIYAASFKKTNTIFPLVWSAGRKDVYAENVTDTYTKNGQQKKGLGLPQDQVEIVDKAALAYFSAGATERASWRFDGKLDQCLSENESAVRRAVWKAYLAAPIHAELSKDFQAHQVRFKEHVSPYVVRQVGDRPANGWPLVIAMHGGGNTPKAVNDSQWKTMQKYYKDQPALGGYQYLALRAPNDTWNGFYDEYVPPLITNLIRQFVVLGDVDPDKVFLIGYSHGGYGAFYIGPKIPDRFAAVHCSAGAPTDGTISPLSLRNTRFTFMIGEKDTAYGRRMRCEAFNEEIQKLKTENKDAFPVEMEFKAGYAHSGLPDRDKLKEMYPYTRKVTPRHLTWDLTDAVISDFFWVSVPAPSKGQSIDVAILDNHARITTKDLKEFTLGVDSRLVDFSKPLRVTLNGKDTQQSIRPSFAALCESMLNRGDPELAYCCRLHFSN